MIFCFVVGVNDGCFIGGCDPEKLDNADLNMDGHLDLSMASLYAGSQAGNGDGSFEIFSFLSYMPEMNFVFIDMDSDGDPDIADRSGRIFRNTTITQDIEDHEPGPISDLILTVSPNPFLSSVTVCRRNAAEAGVIPSAIPAWRAFRLRNR
ncbi:MAG: hypothetical protein GQ565_08865 [Candidatus Aegiribacteria sp.]|nr:hypothetical protein [Candidatus Aegiribacteria sp.]